MKQKWRGIAWMLLILLGLSGCGRKAMPDEKPQAPAPSAKAGASQRITAAEALERMQADAPYILLDVRTPAEFAQEHIAGALLIPGDELAARAAEELPDRGAVIFLYCRSGRRSAIAAQQLAEMGYQNVYDFGGIIDWPYGTVSGGA